MKRILAAVMAISILTLGMAGCKKKFPQNKYLKEKTEEMTKVLTDLTSNESYVRAMGSSTSMQEYCDDWSRANINKKKDIIVLEGDQLAKIMEVQMSADLDDFPEEIQANMSAMFCSSAPSVLNATNGQEILATSSAFRYSRTYVPDGSIDNQVWLIPTTRDDVLFCLVFVESGDDAITATATYVIAPNGVNQLIEDTFHSKVKFEKLEWD